MRIKDALITSVATAAAIPSIIVGTCFGTLFVPSLAAGSAALVIGATTCGLQVAFLPTVFFSGMAALSNNPVSKIGFSILAASSFLGGIVLGGALFGLAMETLMPCIGLGIAIAGLGALITIGLAKLCFNAFMDELTDTTEVSSRPPEMTP